MRKSVGNQPASHRQQTGATRPYGKRHILALIKANRPREQWAHFYLDQDDQTPAAGLLRGGEDVAYCGQKTFDSHLIYRHRKFASL